MNTLLSPAIRLTARFRISQKVALVAIAFAVPLIVLVALLFQQMRSDVSAAIRKQQAISSIQSLQHVQNLIARHRALTHMQLSGNKQLGDAVENLRKQIAGEIKTAPLSEQQKTAWQNVADASSNAKPPQNFNEHSKLIDDIQSSINQLSNDSKLTLDADFTTHKLISLSITTLPMISNQLSIMAARGAAYIDTGLFEGGEDVMLNSLQMTLKTEIRQSNEQLAALEKESTAYESISVQIKATLEKANFFLNRAQDEVLASVNQSSGNAFNSAGQQVIEQLSHQSDELSSLIQQRLEAQIHQLNMQILRMFAMIAILIVIAAYFLLAIYTAFKRDIKMLTEAIEKTASGDLSSTPVEHAEDELGQLLSAVNDMKSGLARLIDDIRLGAAHIDTIAEEIHQENTDLSVRTESQADALQETASAVEQLTASTQENAGNLAQASSLVDSAADRVRHGLNIMQEAITSMQSVTSSSQKISEIIGVMDGIAFQTNILALNAAVEAARAGQEGRGFAVVASEVRNLAQRSANAAKEIKTLIDSSGHAVKKGSEMINTAGSTMQKISENVAQVSDLIRHVAHVGQQQSNGISSVNQAISSIDEVTQHNATLVEQAKDSTDRLSQQAQILNTSVSAFTIGDKAPTLLSSVPGPRLVTTSNTAKPSRLPIPLKLNSRKKMPA